MTRNASESLQIVQNGIDLVAGDEVVTTEQDYPRMLTTWDQRVRRDKLVLTRVQFPVPTSQQDLFERLTKAITPKTKVLHFCHITNLTGQLFPVQRICRHARERGIFTIVDGAHAGAQFPFKLRDLECDAYGVSLHKWLLAPFGTGFLYVRRDKIDKVWPLQAAPARSQLGHPQVRGNRHGAARAESRHRGRPRLPSGDRRRPEGRAAVLSVLALGQPPRPASEDQDPLELQAG